MGRAGETVRRTFAMAAVNKGARGPLPGDPPDADNERVLRYLAKLTINPAITHGIDSEVGSLEVGKLADIVLWQPAWFGAKPAYVLKAGLPAWAAVGDPNAAVDTAQPLVLGPQFAGSGAAPTRRRRVAVRGTRAVGLRSMLAGNARTGVVRVDPGARRVTLDGDELRVDPAQHVPLTRLYHL
jgi:urease subunit alpha